MPPDVAGALVAVVGIVSIGAIALLGMRMRFKHKLEMHHHHGLASVHEALDTLNEQSQTMREEIIELQERLDFHERLLTRPTQDQANTPV